MQFETEGEYIREQVWKTLKRSLGIRKSGYQYTKAYKMRVWDGITHEGFVDEENNRFASGLLDQAVEALGKLQNSLVFHFSVEHNTPEPLMDVEDVPNDITLEDGEITLRDYQYSAVVDAVAEGKGIWHLSTNAGKTKTAIGLAKIALPYLQTGERVAIFTESREIFEQFKKEIEKSLGLPVGVVTSQKTDIEGKQIIMCMTGTVANRLNIDVEKDVKLTPKQRITKRMAKLADEFGTGRVNQRMLLESYVNNYKVKFKTDEEYLDEIRKVLKKSETDHKIIFNLNTYRKKYTDILKSKNKESYNKKKKMTDFMDSVTVAIYDEAHHVSAETYYTTVMGSENALIKVGMTGSIDKADNFIVQRIKAGFNKVISRITNEEMIERGISAKPKVAVIPINQVIDDLNKERIIFHERNYQEAYDVGIVQNQYRNGLIAKITQMWYTRGKGILVVVNRLEHGERIQELLNQLNVPSEFIHGEADNRSGALQEMKDGEIKVLISTNIIDEGVDISNIDVLVMSSGGKSLRQTLQRIGRSLRKKSQGENKALIIDFDDRTNTYLSKHSGRRTEIYADEKFEIEFLED